MKIKDFFLKMGYVKSSVRKVSVSVENFLEWKSDGVFFIANVIFFSLLSFSAE